MDASARGGHTGYAAIPGTDALRRAVADRIAEPANRAALMTHLRSVTGMPAGWEDGFVAQPGGDVDRVLVVGGTECDAQPRGAARHAR